jgi:hypothetical protein
MFQKSFPKTLVVMALIGCLLSVGDTPAGAVVTWNRHGSFTLPRFDTGNIRNRCYVRAPWGRRSWGIEGATFTSTDFKLDWQRFASFSGDSAYLYGQEQRGEWGFVRYVQGSVWGGTNCGPIPWHRPAPLSFAGKTLMLHLDLYRDTHTLLQPGDSWVMFAINVWISSPHFPKAGEDVNGRKPLVLDLVFYRACNWAGCGLRHFEDSAAYHYQATIGRTPHRRWRSWQVNLSTYIDNALNTFGLPATHAKLYQMEFVVELHNAEGVATIDNFYLRY